MLLNYQEFLLRRKLSKKKMAKNIINPEVGIAKFKIDTFENFDNVNMYLESLKSDFYKVDWNKILTNHSKKFLLISKINCDDQRIQKLVELVTPTVSEYLNTLPVLQSAAYWYSPNTFNDHLRSQNSHIDGEDFKQVKVWIPVEDVDENCGPLNAININTTQIIFKKINKSIFFKKRNRKITDEEMNNFLTKNDINVLTMKTDEICFVDTCNCYHFGSRKDDKPKKLIHLHFTSAFSENIPLFGRKKELKGFDESSLINQYYKNNYEYVKDNTKLKKFEFKIL